MSTPVVTYDHEAKTHMMRGRPCKILALVTAYSEDDGVRYVVDATNASMWSAGVYVTHVVVSTHPEEVEVVPVEEVDLAVLPAGAGTPIAP